MLTRLLGLVVTVYIILNNISHAFRSECDYRRLHDTVKDTNQTYYLYVLTQDCQLVFSRSDQLEELQRYLEVQRDLTHCAPSKVHLNLRDVYSNGKIGFQLLFKRGHNQLCLLPVDFPTENAMAGYSVFSYSLLNSMSYATCSYMTNTTFALEPNLSFMDSTFSDVIYFVDPKAAGTFWSVRQFKISYQGFLQAMEPFVIKNFAEETGFSSRMAGEFYVNLDTERSKLYTVHKRDKDMASTCSYDVLFRPHRARVHRRHMTRQHHHSHHLRINSFASDVNISLYTESEPRGENQHKSKVFMIDRRKNMSATCILRLPYQATIGIISKEVLDYLNNIKLPRFSEKIKEKQQKSHKPIPLSKSEESESKGNDVTTSTVPIYHKFLTKIYSTTTRRPVTITTKPPPITVYPHKTKFTTVKHKLSSESSTVKSTESSGDSVEKSSEDSDSVDEGDQQPQSNGDKDSGAQLQSSVYVMITAAVILMLS
ncbi:unnamed protein product [Bursaphelenchus okinawaensis]|uniref:Uncharacterized protein n=1 Tax=Bursaphelenchus okinawaensis TaxID=465554 RepID=A0A811KTN2_9BILA|nr:unnamed protein product [Bursaphelenchus okinawaensis]CAG9113075.1 unnamed protein product [Bursaphelenchus okinawaensis]